MLLSVEINNDRTEATVHVSVPIRSNRQPKLQYTTDDVLFEIKRLNLLEGYNILGTIKNVLLLNISEKRRKGTAIFKIEAPEDKKTHPVKSHTKSKKKKSKPTKSKSKSRKQEKKPSEEPVTVKYQSFSNLKFSDSSDDRDRLYVSGSSGLSTVSETKKEE